MRAVVDKDDRLALQALDRVRTCLEQLLKVHGMLGGDSPIIDNRTQNIFAGMSKEELRAIAAQLAKGDGESKALPNPGSP